MAEKRKRKKKFLKILLLFAVKILCLLILIAMVQVVALRFINPPFSISSAVLMLKNTYSEKKYIIPKGEWRSLKDISPLLIKAVLASEDQRFMSHNGFDFREINQAVQDIIEEKRVRGASTITMQVARTVFLWRERSMFRKLAEAYYTVLIELVIPKIRIIELYLNMVDWGNGIIGAEAASKKYFNKRASELNASEAALLAAILPSPHKWSPNNPNDQVLARQRRILKNMGKMHL
ncbi:monofunctional biosynthetic peptidoglycan transglycosylase [Thermodesulfobacteriota bacterium]